MFSGMRAGRQLGRCNGSSEAPSKIVAIPAQLPDPALARQICLVLVSPSHGENRGSSPLGSANIFKDLADCYPSASNTCPINACGQRWTIRFASGPRLEGGRLGTNAPIVKDAARFETGTRKCGLMKNPHTRRPAGARSRQVIG